LCHIAGIGATEVSDGLEDRSSVFGVNANELGVTYATAIIALLGLWLLHPRRMTQWLLPFPMIIVIVVAMAKTGSRSSFVVLATGLWVLLVLGKALGTKWSRVAMTATLGVVVIVILWKNPTVLERFNEINTQNIGEQNPRARMAPVLWEMFLRSPVYGLGPDSYQWELTRRAMPYLIDQGKLIASHNLVLLLLVETGIIGFLVFSLGLSTAVTAAWKARLGRYGSVPLALLLPLVLGGITVCNPSHYLVFWFAIAFALASEV
jgi:O-antigen ligase